MCQCRNGPDGNGAHAEGAGLTPAARWPLEPADGHAADGAQREHGGATRSAHSDAGIRRQHRNAHSRRELNRRLVGRWCGQYGFCRDGHAGFGGSAAASSPTGTAPAAASSQSTSDASQSTQDSGTSSAAADSSQTAASSTNTSTTNPQQESSSKKKKGIKKIIPW